jgi:predicted  nucleic acid-binding Zn-ribbon protein
MTLSLSESIRARTPSLGEAQQSYKQDVIAVTTLMTTVMSSTLPALNDHPPDWNDFVTAQLAAQQAALAWANQVLARLLEVPDDVQSYNATIVGYLADAVAQAEVLVADPDNQQALTALQADLNGVVRTLGLITTFISGAITAIQGFQDQMPGLATNLQSIADKSIADANADKTQIDNLKQQIQTLEDDIKSLTAAIVALSIADGIALVMGTVITIAAFPIGALAWLFLGPAVAVATTFIALDAVKIKDDKSAIEALQSAITGVTADVSVLSLLSDKYAQMSTSASALDQSLQSILGEWQALESDVTGAVTDINTALTQADQKAFQQALDELRLAQTAWNDAYAQAGALHLDLNVNNGAIEPGMTSDQVQAAMASGTTVDVITYYNQVGQAA